MYVCYLCTHQYLLHQRRSLLGGADWQCTTPKEVTHPLKHNDTIVIASYPVPISIPTSRMEVEMEMGTGYEANYSDASKVALMIALMADLSEVTDERF